MSVCFVCVCVCVFVIMFYGHEAVNINFVQYFICCIGHLSAESWLPYEYLTLTPGKQYVAFVFPVGYSAHWVRLVSNRNCFMTAYFHYT